jgi:ketosteroid isomerase-like protein
MTELRHQVRDAELAFAKTMADRDFEGFQSYLSEEAVFFTSPTPLRGKDQVIGWWRRYFEAPEAPFSWSPDEIEVLDSGDLAISSGPVFDTVGVQTGRFTSIWRHEQDGWKVIFDKGDDS